MFIKLTAAFRNEEQPDFEGMGIKVSDEDWENVEWMELYIQHDCIVSMNINDVGNTNLTAITGEVWSVKETPEQIYVMCNKIKDEC